MWKKILLLVIVLVLIAVAGVTALSEQYRLESSQRQDIAAVSAATGKEVVFDGRRASAFFLLRIWKRRTSKSIIRLPAAREGASGQD